MHIFFFKFISGSQPVPLFYIVECAKYIRAASVIAAAIIIIIIIVVYDLQLGVRIKTNKLAHLKDDLPVIVCCRCVARFFSSSSFFAKYQCPSELVPWFATKNVNKTGWLLTIIFISRHSIPFVNLKRFNRHSWMKQIGILRIWERLLSFKCFMVGLQVEYLLDERFVKYIFCEKNNFIKVQKIK